MKKLQFFLYLRESGTKIVIFMKILRLRHVINFEDNYTYFFCLKAYIEQYLIMQRNHIYIKHFFLRQQNPIWGWRPPNRLNLSKNL